MSAARSQRWKALERDVAQTLGGVRVHRQLYEKAPDVIVEVAGQRLVVECKAHARFKHHALIETARSKYCHKGEAPALATRERNGRTYVTVGIDLFQKLLEQVRERETT